MQAFGILQLLRKLPNSARCIYYELQIRASEVEGFNKFIPGNAKAKPQHYW